MASFESRFYIENPTRRQALWRDLRLFAMLFLAACRWLSKGLFLRRALRKAKHNGEVIFLEDWGG